MSKICPLPTHIFFESFPDGSGSKEPACDMGDPGSIPGWEDPLEKGMATHSSILAWKIPWTEQPGELQPMGPQRVRHNWVTNTFTFTHIFARLSINQSSLRILFLGIMVYWVLLGEHSTFYLNFTSVLWNT